MRARTLLLCVATWTALMASPPGHLAAHPLEARQISDPLRNVDSILVENTQEEWVERGKPRPFLDACGWVWGIPSKIILWNRRVNNHHIGVPTEDVLRRYLEANQLEHVKVRINQYAPGKDWQRLRANRTVGWPYRYTFGAVSVCFEALLPGRLFGGDRYNPYTATLHLYSDVPALALHEAAHAKDIARRTWPGTYATFLQLPLLEIWPDAIATGDALAYSQNQNDPDRERESYKILCPAFGANMGPLGMPFYAGGVVAGHIAGWTRARYVTEEEPTEGSLESAESFAELPLAPLPPEDEADSGVMTASAIMIETDDTPSAAPVRHSVWTAKE